MVRISHGVPGRGFGEDKEVEVYEELIKRLTACEDDCSRCPMMYDEQVEQDLVREHCAAYEASDAIERLADENTQLVTTANELSKMYDKLVDEMPDGWIPVTERLPEEIRMPVLVVDGRDVIEGYVNAI